MRLINPQNILEFSLPPEEDYAGQGSQVLEKKKWVITFSYLPDLSIILPVAILICFVNLGEYPPHHLDEITHIRVIQEMKLSGNWWQPTAFGEPYYHKPPFKMWLSLLVVLLFGESNFSFRFLDALAGMGTALLCYVFARRLFQCRVSGIFSALLLLGCRSYIFDHGVRHAVQDSFLVFLTTLTLFCAWNFLETLNVSRLSAVTPQHRPSFFGSRQGKWWALGGGLAMGFAALTKNVAGYMPLLIVALYLLISGQGKIVWTKARFAPLVVLGLGLLIPASYLVPHCIADRSACLVMLGHEVVRRATVGYHNQSNFWFYFNRILDGRAAVPGGLLVLAVLFAIYKISWPRSTAKGGKSFTHTMLAERRCYLFLLLWAVVPVILHTFIPSRLLWYVAYAYPGMSLLIGALLGSTFSFLWSKLISWRKGEKTWGLVEVGCLLFLVYGVRTMVLNVQSVGKSVLATHEPILMGALTNDILDFTYRPAIIDGFLKKLSRSFEEPPLFQEPLQIVDYQMPRLAHHEKLYLRRIGPFSSQAKTLEDLKILLSQPGSHFVVTAASNFEDVVRLRPISGYRFLPPLFTSLKLPRQTWMVFLSYQESKHLRNFLPMEKTIKFSELDSDQRLYGWAGPISLGPETVLQSKGSKSAFLFEADGAFSFLGTKIAVNVARLENVSNTSSLKIDVLLNNEKIGELPILDSQFKTYEFMVPPGKWMSGKNVFHLVPHFQDEQVIDRTRLLTGFNWMKIELNQH